MEGFDESKVLQVAGLSDSQYTVPVIVSLGYGLPAQKPQSVRLSPELVFFDDEFGVPLQEVPVLAPDTRFFAKEDLCDLENLTPQDSYHSTQQPQPAPSSS